MSGPERYEIPPERRERWLERWLERHGVVIKVWTIDRDSLELDIAALDALMSERTRLVAVTHASNILGTINPVAEIARLVHERGAQIVVDGVAFAPHRAVDVAKLDVDYYVFSFYKTYGPQSAVMYGKHDRLLALDGLHPPSMGARVSFSLGRPRVTDGPFAEAKEVLGGYWMIQVKSKEEAIEWASRCPASDNEVIEVRQVQEMSDFPADVQKAAAKLSEMKAQSEGAMKGVLGYTEDKVVSTDFRGESLTSVFDAEAGIALDGTFVKVIAWYDNEWGYSNKTLEMVRVVAKAA